MNDGSPQSTEPPLPRRVVDLDQPTLKWETMHQVRGARVVFADLALLQRDFPALAPERVFARNPELAVGNAATRVATHEAYVHQWLLQHAAIASQPQVENAVVNTPIAITDKKREVVRPPAYGRAVVVPVGNTTGPGLLDVKGVGVAIYRMPSHHSHHDGLTPLGEVLANIAVQDLIEAIFRFSNPGFSTLPYYAAIDAGFDTLAADGTRKPAGIFVRRAHRRLRGGGELPAPGSLEQRVKLHIELLLRAFGITSGTLATRINLDEREDGSVRTRYGNVDNELGADDLEATRKATRFTGGSLRIEGVNIQLTRETRDDPLRAQLVDFGHYNMWPTFEHGVASLVTHRPLKVGGVLLPGDPGFVQPHPRLVVPEEDWGWERVQVGDRFTNYQRSSMVCFDLAARFRRGELDGTSVRSTIDALVRRAAARW